MFHHPYCCTESVRIRIRKPQSRERNHENVGAKLVKLVLTHKMLSVENKSVLPVQVFCIVLAELCRTLV